jgi:hypothetical protein
MRIGLDSGRSRFIWLKINVYRLSIVALPTAVYRSFHCTLAAKLVMFEDPTMTTLRARPALLNR